MDSEDVMNTSSATFGYHSVLVALVSKSGRLKLCPFENAQLMRGQTAVLAAQGGDASVSASRGAARGRAGARLPQPQAWPGGMRRHPNPLSHPRVLGLPVPGRKALSLRGTQICSPQAREDKGGLFSPAHLFLFALYLLS